MTVIRVKSGKQKTTWYKKRRTQENVLQVGKKKICASETHSKPRPFSSVGFSSSVTYEWDRRVLEAWEIKVVEKGFEAGRCFASPKGIFKLGS